MEDYTLASAILAFVGALIGSLLVNKFNYKQLFAQTVSSNRMNWINVWRESISTFLACAEVLNDYCNGRCTRSACKSPQKSPKEFLETKKQMLHARAMILSRLNLDEQLHIQMMEALNNFSYNCRKKEFADQRDLVLCLARKILKPEWERVKSEAKGE